MRRLRDSILYLVIQLTILYNIERLDIAGTNVIDIATGVYVLTASAVIMILSIKALRKLPQTISLILWSAIFFAVKLAMMSHRPLVGGVYTYLSFTEYGLFIMAVYLAQNLAMNIDEFEQAVKNFAFASTSKVKRAQDAQEQVQAELYRSRRFQRSLSLVVLEQDLDHTRVDLNKVVQDAQRALMEQYVSAMIVREVTSQLRQTDLLLEDERRGRLIIVSPDTDDLGAKNLIDRLSTLNRNGTNSLSFGTATFPKDGLTYDQLLKHAELNVGESDHRISIEAPKDVETNPAVPVE